MRIGHSSLSSSPRMRYLVTIALLFSLVSSQAGLAWLGSCLCPTSTEHRAACCCGSASSDSGGCCEIPSPKEERPEQEEGYGASGRSCPCLHTSNEVPEPEPAEVPTESLLGLLSVPEATEEVLKPFRPPSEVATYPPPVVCIPVSPTRIRFCSFQL